MIRDRYNYQTPSVRDTKGKEVSKYLLGLKINQFYFLFEEMKTFVKRYLYERLMSTLMTNLRRLTTTAFVPKNIVIIMNLPL